MQYKNWGLMDKENESFAGKVFYVREVRVQGFPNISNRHRWR